MRQYLASSTRSRRSQSSSTQPSVQRRLQPVSDGLLNPGATRGSHTNCVCATLPAPLSWWCIMSANRSAATRLAAPFAVPARSCGRRQLFTCSRGLSAARHHRASFSVSLSASQPPRLLQLDPRTLWFSALRRSAARYCGATAQGRESRCQTGPAEENAVSELLLAERIGITRTQDLVAGAAAEGATGRVDREPALVARADRLSPTSYGGIIQPLLKIAIDPRMGKGTCSHRQMAVFTVFSKRLMSPW